MGGKIGTIIARAGQATGLRDSIWCVHCRATAVTDSTPPRPSGLATISNSCAHGAEAPPIGYPTRAYFKTALTDSSTLDRFT
jgi:hypothetical protein